MKSEHFCQTVTQNSWVLEHGVCYFLAVLLFVSNEHSPSVFSCISPFALLLLLGQVKPIIHLPKTLFTPTQKSLAKHTLFRNSFPQQVLVTCFGGLKVSGKGFLAVKQQRSSTKVCLTVEVRMCALHLITDVHNYFEHHLLVYKMVVFLFAINCTVLCIQYIEHTNTHPSTSTTQFHKNPKTNIRHCSL